MAEMAVDVRWVFREWAEAGFPDAIPVPGLDGVVTAEVILRRLLLPTPCADVLPNRCADQVARYLGFADRLYGLTYCAAANALLAARIIGLSAGCAYLDALLGPEGLDGNQTLTWRDAMTAETRSGLDDLATEAAQALADFDASGREGSFESVTAELAHVVSHACGALGQLRVELARVTWRAGADIDDLAAALAEPPEVLVAEIEKYEADLRQV